jgi:hypothetical protein
MKYFHLLALMLILSLAPPAFSQTLPLEYDTMMNKYLAKEYTQLEYKEHTYAWNALMDSMGYPRVPYDSVSKKVEYKFIHDLDGIPRETIVNRVLEWAAVTFGNTNALLTHQGNASRIILNGSLEVMFTDMFLIWKNSWRGYVETEQLNSSFCYFTLVFTIHEGKMKTQVKNLNYQYTDFVKDQTIAKSLNACFPISSHKKEEWKALISLVNETTGSLNTMMGLLVNYIKDYEQDYSW